MSRAEQLEEQVRKTPLLARLRMCRSMVGKMCSEGRPPKMSIPVRPEDEDFFISTTLQDAIALIEGLADD